MFLRWCAGFAVVAIVMAVPVARASGAHAGTRQGPGPFAGLRPAAAPLGWNRFDVPLPGGLATLSSPPSFAPFAGDRGTASTAVRDRADRIRAYLNVTPRQGDERARGFAEYRVRLLAGDHDQSVHLEAAAEGLEFQGGRGSCVLDHYVTRIGHHHYRELACFVVGRRGDAAVIVAAATTADWSRFQKQLRRAVASFALS
jgi:hypothetical protein